MTPASIGPRIRDHACEKGLICRYAPTSIGLYPPLIIKDEEPDGAAEILLDAFAAAWEERA